MPFVIETPAGEKIGVVLIAGLIARRIVTFVGEGAGVGFGEHIGLIRFGSRVDVYLPAGGDVLVAPGQRRSAADGRGRAARRRCSRQRPLGWRRGFRPMFPPFDPEKDDRKPQAPVSPAVDAEVPDPQHLHLLGLCAGLTAIRMAIEHRWDLAVATLVFAAFLDGIDGRVGCSRPNRASGPSSIPWPISSISAWRRPSSCTTGRSTICSKVLGWIAVLIYAVCAALGLRVSMWRSTGQDLPGRGKAAIRRHVGAGRGNRAAADLRAGSRPAFADPHPARAALYARRRASDGEPRADFSGKLIGPEDRARIIVLPVFVLVALFIACLLTYPSLTLAVGSVIYLALIPDRRLRYFQVSGRWSSLPRAKGASNSSPLVLVLTD